MHYALLSVGSQGAFEFAKKFKKIGKIISMHYANKPERQGEFLELTKGTFE